MATLSPQFLEAVEQASHEPIFLAEIEIDASDTFFFAKSSRRVVLSDIGSPTQVALSIAAIPELEYAITPGVPKMQIPDITVTFKADDFVRDVIDNHRLKGKPIEIRLGFPNMTTRAQFGRYWTGTFDDIVDNPQDGRISWKCLGDYILPRDRTATGVWIAQHPLQAFKSLLDFAGVPAARIDAASFDPDTYPLTIAHWALSREQHGTAERAVIDPEEVSGLMEELIKILPGSVVITEDGIIKFVEYDGAATKVKIWTTADATFKQERGVGEFYNRVIFEGGWRGQGERSTISDDKPESSSEYDFRVTLDDTTSQTNHARVGAATYIKEYPQLASRWIGSEAALETAIDNVETAMTLRNGNVSGFSGARDDGAANFALDANRTAYYLIRSVNGVEIVSSNTALTINTTLESPIPDYKYETTDIEEVPPTLVVDGFTVSGMTRSLLGTTAPAAGHPATDSEDERPTEVFDITIAVAINRLHLTRFSNGAPVIQATTNLTHHDVEIADMVGVTWPLFTAFGFKGVINGTFQVVSKRVNVKDGVIEFGLLMDRINTPIQGWDFKVFDIPTGWTGWNPWLDKSGWVARKWDITISAGLVGTLGAGSGGTRRERPPRAPKDFDFTFKASRDSYVGMDRFSGRYLVTDVANGAAAPAVGPYELRLGKVVTSGAAITSIDQSFEHRKITGILGAQIKGLVGPCFTTLPDPHFFEPGQVICVQADAQSEPVRYRRRQHTLRELLNTIKSTVPLTHWSFNEALAADDAIDYSGNGNDGVAQNAGNITVGSSLSQLINDQPALYGATVEGARTFGIGGAGTGGHYLVTGLGDIVVNTITMMVWLMGFETAGTNTLFDLRDSASAIEFRSRLTSVAAGSLETTVNGTVHTSTKIAGKQDWTPPSGRKCLFTQTWESANGGNLRSYLNGQFFEGIAGVSAASALAIDNVAFGCGQGGNNQLGATEADNPTVWDNQLLSLAEIQRIYEHSRYDNVGWELIDG